MTCLVLGDSGGDDKEEKEEEEEEEEGSSGSSDDGEVENYEKNWFLRMSVYTFLNTI